MLLWHGVIRALEMTITTHNIYGTIEDSYLSVTIDNEDND